MIFSREIKKCFLNLFLVVMLFCPMANAESLDSKLKEIEKSYYGYSLNGSLESRLSNLEKSLYGKSNTGLSKNRIEKLYNDLNIGIATGGAVTMQADSNQQQTKDIGPKADAGIKYPVVDKLEQKVFKTTYPNDDIYNRLSRLEKQTFKKESTLSLNERVDALRGRILGGEKIATTEINPYTEEIILENGKKYYGMDSNTEDSQYNYYSYENSKNRVQKVLPENSDNDFSSVSGQNYDLDILEKQLFGKRFTEELPSQRLTRLENKVFERTFSDSDDSRIQRLLAVTTAQKTSKEYDSNRWAQRLNAGMQIGSILLMVLAMIL